MIVELNGIAIEIIKKPIKNMHLRIYPPDGRVRVSAPLHFKEKTILAFLHKQSLWIDTQIKRMKERSPVKEERLETGSTILFKGESYSLVLFEHHGPAHVECRDGFIYCHIPHASSTADINALLERWYKKELHDMIPALIKHWEALIHVQVKEWGVKKMKTRWGSCNTRAQRIWLNLNLIKKPPICLEYVLVHELTHLLEASHNARFYHLMEQFMPQWRDYDYLLEGKRSRK